MFREACGKCHFANTRRPSDITLGDFWGWEKTDPEINKDDKGVSLVFINTEKGYALFEAVKDRLIVASVKIEDCLQPNLRHSSVLHPLRKVFEREYKKKGFEYVLNKNYDRSIRFILIASITKFLTIIKKLIRQYTKK